MLFLTHTPALALRSLVDHYFLMHIQVEKGAEPVLCPFPPTPLQFIVFYLDDLVITKKEGEGAFRRRGRCVVVGPQSTRMNLLVRESHRCFVIAFRPGGLYRLLGIPMQELYDDGFEGADLVGSPIDRLTEQLLHTAQSTEMAQAADQWLLERRHRIREALPIDLALELLMQHDGHLSMEQIASRACLSLRQFERKCTERIGYSPKFFARLSRFSRAYRLREQHPGWNWTAIAHSSGYYDQMHFIRDFKQFAGITPTGMQELLRANPFPMQAPLKF